jgi:hypothetical protein
MSLHFAVLVDSLFSNPIADFASQSFSFIRIQRQRCEQRKLGQHRRKIKNLLLLVNFSVLIPARFNYFTSFAR